MVETRSRDAPPRQTRSGQQPTARAAPKPAPAKPKPTPAKPKPGPATKGQPKATTAGPTKVTVTGGAKGREGVPAGTAKKGGGSRKTSVQKLREETALGVNPPARLSKTAKALDRSAISIAPPDRHRPAPSALPTKATSVQGGRVRRSDTGATNAPRTTLDLLDGYVSEGNKGVSEGGGAEGGGDEAEGANGGNDKIEGGRGGVGGGDAAVSDDGATGGGNDNARGDSDTARVDRDDVRGGSDGEGGNKDGGDGNDDGEGGNDDGGDNDIWGGIDDNGGGTDDNGGGTDDNGEGNDDKGGGVNDAANGSDEEGKVGDEIGDEQLAGEVDDDIVMYSSDRDDTKAKTRDYDISDDDDDERTRYNPTRASSPSGYDDSDLAMGSSRATGGLFRGKALGNHPNFGDFRREHDSFNPLPLGKGLVYIYDQRDQATNPMSVKCDITYDLPGVLRTVGNSYSPIRKRDSRIFIQDGDSWSVKGRYSKAILLREPIQWETDEGSNDCWLSIAAENDSVLAPALAPAFTPTPITQPVVSTTSSHTSSRSRTRPSANNPYRDELIAALDIPESLVLRTAGTLDVRTAWGKYKGCQAAQGLLHRMKNDGTWTLAHPTTDEIVELFISKSSWHENFTKIFPVARKYPILVDWLEQGADAPKSADVWGVEKSVYSFGDLEELLRKLKARREKKDKRKAESVDESSVDEESRKRKLKAKKSRKSKKSSGSF